MTPRLHAAVRHRSPEGKPVAQHQHPQHELVLILQGEVRVTTAGTVLPGQPGEVQVFPARVSHDQASRGAWRTLCVLYSGDAPPGPRTIATGGDALVRTWMEHLCELAGSRDEDAAAGDALLAALLARLAGLERRAAQDAHLHPALASAERVIRAGLAAPLDVADLARQVGLSHSHLGSLFRARHGCSPLQWHLRLRLERARTLLANPYTSVSAVAADLGFSDLNYFVRRFRAAHGRPPGAWRRAEAR